MKFDPDKFLNQLVVTAITIFTVVLLLVGTLILHHFWLQQHIVDLSEDVQISLEDLNEITGEFERELGELKSSNDAAAINNLAEISEVLVDVDDQLEDLEANLSEVVVALDPPQGIGDERSGQAQLATDQVGVDRIFTIFTVLVSLAAIGIAVLLGATLWVQQNSTYTDNPY